MLEEEMATHSSVLAWGIPGTVEPGGLPSMGSHRVGHDWSDLEQQQLYVIDVIRRPLVLRVVDTASILEMEGSRPEELNKGGITNTNEETGCHKKDKEVSEEVKLPVYLALKDIAKNFSEYHEFKEYS